MKNGGTSISIILILLLLGLTCGVVVTLYINNALNKGVPNKIEKTNEQIIGGDKDKHGCLIGAGYSWCEIKQKCLSQWEEPCEVQKSDENLIKNALVTKNNWNPEEINVTISKNDGKYATGETGTVTPQGGGGLFFAKKVNGNWEIVWDGNGIITCEALTKYPDFPSDLIPQCYDQTKNTMVIR